MTGACVARASSTRLPGDLANAKTGGPAQKGLASRVVGAGRYRSDVKLCYKVDLA
jgi:hypothetical protein